MKKGEIDLDILLTFGYMLPIDQRYRHFDPLPEQAVRIDHTLSSPDVDSLLSHRIL